MVDGGVLVIGCGRWGKNLARNLAELGALKAIVDPMDYARAVAEHLGAAHFDDLDAALAAGGCVAAVIATPAETHHTVGVRALEAGLDVFIEKPIALIAAHAEDLAALALAKGKVLMVGHLLQYHPAFQALKALVAEGRLGKVLHINSTRRSFGAIRSEEDVVWSFSPHDVSMVLALAGAAPTEACAIGHAALQPGVADIASVHLTFGGGLMAQVSASWLHPFKEQKLVVIGEAAMAVFDDALPWAEKLVIHNHHVDRTQGAPRAAPGDREVVDLPEGEPLKAEMCHFLECIEKRAKPLTDAAEALAVLKVLQAAQASQAKGGGWVDLKGAAPAASPSLGEGVFVHETAIVDAGSSVGARTKIWHFSHVLGKTTLGTDCVIGQNCVLGPEVTIGNGCKLQNNVSVYKGVTLADKVFCGPSMVFTNVMTPRAHVERKNEFAPTFVGEGATLGANCTIICGNNIGRFAMVGAGAVVTKDVPDYALVVGNPAKRIGWVSNTGERLGEDLTCPRTGERYEIDPLGMLRVLAPGRA